MYLIWFKEFKVDSSIRVNPRFYPLTQRVALVKLKMGSLLARHVAEGEEKGKRQELLMDGSLQSATKRAFYPYLQSKSESESIVEVRLLSKKEEEGKEVKWEMDFLVVREIDKSCSWWSFLPIQHKKISKETVFSWNKNCSIMIDNKLFKLWTWHFYCTHYVGIQFSVTSLFSGAFIEETET